LKSLLKKIWSKIGQRKVHTNQRLREQKIIKLEDELKISELKVIWRWLKNKIPLGLKSIIIERQHNLRHRSFVREFVRELRWKQDSLSYRLASRANKEINELVIAKSKNGLKNKFKNKILLTEYVGECRIRNCFICMNR
jgi:hypothetical protein